MSTAFIETADWVADSEPVARPPCSGIGAELRRILARKDDHLLRDIGLTREDVLGPEDIARAEWRAARDIWNL